MSTHFPLIRRRTFLAGALGTAVAGGTAACGFGNDESDPEPDAQDQPSGETEAPSGPMVLRQSMLPVPHLDPHIGNPGSASGNILQAGLFEGLLVTSADSDEPLPGVAESWEVSDDGLVYTFTLRADARWSNGDPVVAEDFVWNWQRRLSPDLERPARAPYNHSRTGVSGADAYLAGETDDFETVGVKALDERTFEVTLEFLNPNFLWHMAAWQTVPLHPATVEEFGPDWQEPENWVSNGPFVLESWQPNAQAVLVPNPEYWDADNYHITRWEVVFSDAGDSQEMVSYQADELDVFRVEGDVAAVMTDPALAEELAVSKSVQWRCLVLMSSHNEVLRDIRVRQALSLAINREALAELTIPDVPAGSLLPDGIPGSDQMPQTGFEPDQARDLLADAGYSDGEGMPTIQLMSFTRTPWLEAVGAMWQEELGVQTSIDLVEVGVYGDKLRAVHPEDYLGFAYGNFGSSSPTLFSFATQSIGQRFGDRMMPASAYQQILDLEADESLDPADRAEQIQTIRDENTDPEWKTYEDLVAQASAEVDESARNDLLIQAAIAREEAYVALPVLWGGYNLMVKPRVRNLQVQGVPQVFRLNGVEIIQT